MSKVTFFTTRVVETCSDDTFTIDVQVKDFLDIVGFQWALTWEDRGLSLVDVSSSVLHNEELDYQYLNEKRRVNVFWSSAVALPIKLLDSTIVLRLHFKSVSRTEDHGFSFVHNPLDQTAPEVVYYDVGSQVLTEYSPTLVSTLKQDKISRLAQVYYHIDSKTCDNEDLMLHIDSIKGGKPPFLFAMNNEVYTPTSSFRLNPGNFRLYTQDVFGCVLDTPVIVQALIPPVVIASASPPSIKIGDTVILSFKPSSSIPIKSVSWQGLNLLDCNNCTTGMAAPKQSATYSVLVEFENKCKTEAVVQVEVQKKRTMVYAPNAFTPNKDGVNDLFMFYGAENWELKNCRIVDRWGNEVFFQKSLQCNMSSTAWDGTVRGAPCPSATYFWRVEVLLKEPPGSSVEYGSVQLFREN